jgi:hypothetical protein
LNSFNRIVCTVAVDFRVFGGELPEGIVAEVLVVVEVFAASGEREDPLGEQPALGVCDEVGDAGVGNGVVDGVDQSELFVRPAEEQNAGVGGDLTAREIGMNYASSEAGKRQGVCSTLCHHDGSGEGPRFGVITSSCTNP